MTIKIKYAFSVGVAVLAMGTSSVMAKVSQEEANRLCKELTCMGAIKEGNATGTIPAFTGETLGVPKGVKWQGTGHYYPNPYADEEPLITITGKDYQKYKQNLTEGQVGLFEKYPDTFKMKVYPTKRDTRYSDLVYQNIKNNALNGELVDGGNGSKYAFGGSPFPIPKDGVELIWNHEYSQNPFFAEGDIANAAVFKDGNIAMDKAWQSRFFTYFDPKASYEKLVKEFDGVTARVLITVSAPPREAGKVTLVHEFIDLSAAPRNAWQYLPGTRRVRRAPTIAYDFPDGPGGLRTVDDAFSFIGATDRYTWKMEAKREVYIPYNNYDMDSPSMTYSKLLTPNHPNADAMRYELHRVWVVVAELKEGKRHIYAKRRVYIDEDTWSGLMADNYDGQGSLWRTTMRTTQNLFDMPGMGPRLEIYHDLQKNAYLVTNLVNEEGGVPKISDTPRPIDFYTPDNLRKLGK